MDKAVYVVLEESFIGGTSKRFLWLARNRTIAELLVQRIESRVTGLCVDDVHSRRQLILVAPAELGEAERIKQHRRYVELSKHAETYCSYDDPEVPWTDFFNSPDVPESDTGFGVRRRTDFDEDFEASYFPEIVIRCYMWETELAVELGVGPGGEPPLLLPVHVPPDQAESAPPDRIKIDRSDPPEPRPALLDVILDPAAFEIRWGRTRVTLSKAWFDTVKWLYEQGEKPVRTSQLQDYKADGPRYVRRAIKKHPDLQEILSTPGGINGRGFRCLNKVKAPGSQ